MFARTVRILLWVSSVAAIAGFIALSVARMPSSYPASSAESVMLEQAERIAEGRALYPGPEAARAVPTMPGMPWLLSVFVTLFGAGLWEARLVTLLAALAMAAFAFVIVRAETSSGLLGTASAGLLLAGFAAFTLREGQASPEPLALALGFGALGALRFTHGLWGVVAAAALVAASFFVHPLGLGFVAAALAYLALHHSKHALVFVSAAAVLCGGGYVALSQGLGPWFNFNAWDGPVALLRFRPLHLLHALGDGLLGRLGVLTISAVLAFALPTRPWRGPTGLWMWGAFAGVAFALLATQNVRLSARELVPALVALAIVGPISAQRVTQHLAAWPGSSRLGGQSVVMVALALQFVILLAGATAAVLPPAV